MAPKIGLIVGREWSWPPAFIEEVNKRNIGVTAEFAKLGGTRMDEPCPYAVLVDRISHEVPYYRSYLKNAMLQGTHVVNNPFMWTADDKFFGASLITRLGVMSPKTVVLPNKSYVDDVTDAYVLAAEAPLSEPGAVSNVGTGVQTRLRDIVEVVRRLLGVTLEPDWGSFPDRKWDTTIWRADVTRIGKELGWTPRHDMEAGLLGTVAWFRDEDALTALYRERLRS